MDNLDCSKITADYGRGLFTTARAHC